MRRVQGVGIGCALAASIVDQASKAIAISMGPRLEAGIEVLPFFNLVLLRNRGVSFGLLADLPWWALTILGFLAVTGLSVWLWRTDRKLDAAAIGLTIGGALGNIADRMQFGAVTDFLDFHVGVYHWPAFNFADISIVSGLALLLWKTREEHRREPAS
jgi:signal peptidase II